MALYGNPNVTGVERTFQPHEVIVSKTDLTGRLIYANRTFYELASMDEKEVIGQQHNIIRHPEMPRCVFGLLWDTLQSGEEIFAYVNNRSKNGDNYWVLAHVTPSYGADGQIDGYHSNRRVPRRDTLEGQIMPLYAELLALEKSHSSAKDALQAGKDKISSMLEETSMSFNELMFSMGI